MNRQNPSNRPTIDTVARNANLLPSYIRLSEENRESTNIVRLVAEDDQTPIFLRDRRYSIKDGGCFYRASLECDGQLSSAVKCVRIEYAADLNNEIRIERYLVALENNQALQDHVILPHDVYTNREQADAHADERYYFVSSRLASEGDLWETIFEPDPSIRPVGIDQREMNCKGYFRQIAQAVNFLHERNIYHCDLKPENIAVHVENGETHLYIIDFGKATVENENIIAYRRYGTGAYSPADLGIYQRSNYMFDWRKADVWALGIILYSMLVRKMPLWHNTQHQAVVSTDNRNFQAICRNRGLAGILRQIGLSDGAMDLLQNMLLEKPADRISTNDILNHPWFNQE